MLYFRLFILFIVFAVCLLGGCSNSLDFGYGEPFSIGISYSVQENSHVNLWIVNSYKTKVATLVDEVQQAGSYDVSFEAIDSNGNNLPEGIYSYHFETENNSESRFFYIKHQ